MAKAKEKTAAKAKTKTKPASTGGETKSVVKSQYRANYTRTDVKTASGKRFAVDRGDEAAEMLRGKSVEELGKVAQKYGLRERFDAKWSKLNPGLCRMALGNALRNVLRQKAAKSAEKKAA